MATMRILIIGDEAVELSREMRISTNRKFWTVTSCNVYDSLQLLSEGSFDTVLLSQFVEGKPALEIAASIRMYDASSPIVVLNDESSDTITHEPTDGISYISSTMPGETVVNFVELQAECHNLQIQNGQLKKSIDQARNDALANIIIPPVRPVTGIEAGAELVGSSEAIRKVRREIAEVASTDMSVMILGETGTGKDVIARSLHEAGNKSGEYVKICCPALPEQLLESELFGHESGAFTGATKQKPGRLELAMNGSVFLDEITEMAPYIQAKLLEVLESKTFMRVGSTRPIEVNLSFYAASNVPLDELFDKKGFRRDLFYRLNQYSIEVPPLRDRIEDVPELAKHFLNRYGAQFNHNGLSVSRDFMDRLMNHRWPGNIREFESVIRKYALTQDENVILHDANGEAAPAIGRPRVGLIRENECELIKSALEEAKWNRREAAKILGMSYNTLRRRIANYELV